MSLKENIINITPNVIKERFPFKATSVENFVELVKIKNATNVTTEYDIKGEALWSPGAGGGFGFLSFSTIYTAETPEKRKIKFTEVHPGGGFVTISGRPTYHEIVKSFVTAENRLADLKEILPRGITTERSSEKSIEKHRENREEMLSYAEKNHIKPYTRESKKLSL